MKHSFSAPQIKIDRARRHISELEQAVTDYVASAPLKVFPKAVVVDGKPDIQITMEMTPPPEHLGAILGDILHNLRVVLDLAACDMVRSIGGDPKGVYFPFSDTADRLDERIRSQNFHRAGDDAIALLKTLQPYHHGNTKLRALHDLDIEDKHRNLLPQPFFAQGPIINTYDETGTINPTVELNSEVIIFLFPAIFDGKMRSLFPVLKDLVQLVDGIVEAFRALANRDDAI